MEKKVQASIIKYLESEGAYIIKIISANKAGNPDIIACLNGRFIGIEVKDINKSATKLQLYKLDLINKAGGIGFVANCVNDVKLKIKEALKNE